MGPGAGGIPSCPLSTPGAPRAQTVLHLDPLSFCTRRAPEQVELYTHGEAVQRLLQRLEKWGCRLTAVHLVDAHHCR